jgi:hypothetical protein
MVKRFKQLLLAKFLYYFETDDEQMSLLKVSDYHRYYSSLFL